MGWLEIWVGAALLLSGAATAWALQMRGRRGPSRGFGAAAAALVVAGVVAGVFLHGAAAGVVAWLKGRPLLGGAALGIQALLLLGLLVRRR